MREKLGFTADLPPSPPGVERPGPSMAPMNRFFSSVEATELRRDEEELLQCCQIHQCSKFCLRKGVCKVGCGKEQNTGKGDTPGFPSRKHDCIEKDHRGITKIFLKRDHPRVNQTSLFALDSWRANCDVQVLLYKGDPKKPDIMEIASIVDYVIRPEGRPQTPDAHPDEHVSHHHYHTLP